MTPESGCLLETLAKVLNGNFSDRTFANENIKKLFSCVDPQNIPIIAKSFDTTNYLEEWI